MSVAKSSTVAAPRACSRAIAASVSARPRPRRRASGATPSAPIQPVAPKTRSTPRRRARRRRVGDEDVAVRAGARERDEARDRRAEGSARQQVGDPARLAPRVPRAPRPSMGRGKPSRGRGLERGGSRVHVALALDGRASAVASRAGVHEQPDRASPTMPAIMRIRPMSQVDARDRVGHRVAQDGAHGDEEDASSNGHARSLSRLAARLHPSGRLYDGRDERDR